MCAVLLIAVEARRAVLASLHTIATQLSAEPFTLMCSAIVAAGALTDADALSQLTDRATAAVDAVVDKLGRVKARSALADATITANSYCGFHERWRFVESQVLADDEVCGTLCFQFSCEYHVLLCRGCCHRRRTAPFVVRHPRMLR